MLPNTVSCSAEEDVVTKCADRYMLVNTEAYALSYKFSGDFDDDVFYLFLQKQKIGAELHIYLEEGTYHKRLFRGPNTNDMKK